MHVQTRMMWFLSIAAVIEVVTVAALGSFPRAYYLTQSSFLFISALPQNPPGAPLLQEPVVVRLTHSLTEALNPSACPHLATFSGSDVRSRADPVALKGVNS